MPIVGTIPPPAQGGGGGSPSTNALRVSILDYGGVANGSTDNASAFDAAYAALKTKLSTNNKRRGEIYFPGATNTYMMSRPMKIEDPYVWIVGDGTCSKISNQTAGPVVLLGFRTTETVGGQTVALDASYRPDSNGKLDASVGTTPGTRWGFRTKGDATIIFSNCPLSDGMPDAFNYGLAWDTVNKLTIEIAVEPGTGTNFPSGSTGGFFSLGGYGGAPEILSLTRGGGTNQFDLKITNALGEVGFATISNPSGTGVQRLCWQIDLSGSTRTCIGFVNGTQVSVGTSGACFSNTGATTFKNNDYSPFLIGASPILSDGRPLLATSSTTGIDYNCYGFQLFNGTPYANNGVGQPQARADAGTLNDNYRYGQGGKQDNKILAQLYRTDSPLSDPTNRRVTMYNGPIGGFFYGWFLQNRMFTEAGGIAYNGIADLQLIGRSGKAQATVELGSTLHTTIERCDISGGTYAIGAVHSLANYFNNIRDCQLSGTLGCVFTAWSDTRIKNTTFVNSGRCAVRAWASNTYIDDCKITFMNENAEYCLRTHQGLYGSLTDIKLYLIDAEGGHCSVATLGFDHFQFQPTYVNIDGVYFGSSADGKSILQLNGLASPTTAARIVAKNLAPASAAATWTYVATITKNSWRGTIDVVALSGLNFNFPDGGTGVSVP